MKNLVFLSSFTRTLCNIDKENPKPYNFSLSKHAISACAASASMICSSFAYSSVVDINEIHYDNAGSDVGEGIEIVGLNGTDLTDWSLVFYNGNDGKAYKTILLGGTISAATNNSNQPIGFLHIPVSGLQNGPADGVALADSFGSILSFLSYEGSIVASNGPAAGLASSDIALSQSGTDPTGQSLQRTDDILWDGVDLSFSDQVWQSAPSSWGSINLNQTISINDPTINPVPVPASALLFASAIGAGALTRIQSKGRQGTKED